MRTLCDVCESAAAIFFCAADEAALCQSCDDKVHMCNKLANRHVRVKLADPYAVPRCDICENAPAFFFCEVDGSSLCLQCDMVVHVGGKKTHRRYLMLRQRVEFPVNNSGQFEDRPPSQGMDSAQNRRESAQLPKPVAGSSADGHRQADANMIDVNTTPHQRLPGRASNDDTYNGRHMQ